MAASRVCVACVFRLANCSRNVPRNRLIHSATSQKYTQFLQNPASSSVPQRNYGDHPPNFYPKGQKLKEEPRTGVEVSTDEWKYVERLIPPLEPPALPKHKSYPTPSGFMPPTGASADTPYHVRRSRFHQIPVYREVGFGGTRQLTVVGKVDGDIWALANELKDHLHETCKDYVNMEIPMQVNEYSRKIWFKGIFVDEVKDYIQKKGF